MKNQRKFIVNGALAFVFILLGFVLGKLVNIHYFFVSKSINIVQVASIIVTVFLAYVVSTVIDKEKTDSRVEKNLIIQRIEDVYQLIEKIRLEFASGEVPYIDAASAVKRLNTSIISVYKIIALREPLKTPFTDSSYSSNWSISNNFI